MKYLSISLLVVIFSTANSFSQKLFPENVYDFLENPAITQVNQERGHKLFVSYDSFSKAIQNDWTNSPNFHSLNGDWKFNWSVNEQQSPRNFFELNFDDKSWSNIKVPGNWETQGFGDLMFRNTKHPFELTPPNVPKDYNPVGSYRKTFTLPAGWKSKQVFLHIEAASSASFVWVNGHEVGYNTGAFEPSEYNIGKYLKPGKNTISVRVFKYSAGTYLEDQDFWRLSGLFRDVYLVATPDVHIRDFVVTTDFDKGYKDATLSLSADIKNRNSQTQQNYKLVATLFDKNAKPVGKPMQFDNKQLNGNENKTLKQDVKVTAPLKWSAEQPNLYKLVLELTDSKGKLVEIVSGNVGFREIEVRNQAMFVNGVPVKLNGVNSHMQHPDWGRTMDVATMRADLIMMKQFNINCVRTSHYPPNKEYLDLADELGMYIVDEVGDEDHAFENLSEKPEWTAAYVNRSERLVLRDRMHPSIIFWSAGNESGFGNNICEVINAGKHLDPTRLWMYGGNTDDPAYANEVPCEEIIGPRYATPAELKYRIANVPDSIDPRPSFMDEYIAATGNGMGGLDEYWDVIWNSPRVIGGAIWDWMSPGMRQKVLLLTDASKNKITSSLNGRAKLEKAKDGGNAISLNGYDQWVDVYQHPALDIAGKQLTLSMWVKPREWNGNGSLLTKGSYQYGLIQDSPNNLQFYIGLQKKDSVMAKLPANWVNNWHHIAGVYDGKNLTIFINGKVAATKIANPQLVGSKYYTGNIINRPFPVNLGRDPEIIGQEYRGRHSNATIDGVSIYNKVIPIEQLIQHDLTLKNEALLWLDFEEITENGEFFSLGNDARSYGLVFPDRTPKPALWQVKKSAQSIHVNMKDAQKGMVEILNRHMFTNLNEFSTVWQLFADDKVVQSGVLDLSLDAQLRMQVAIPYAKPQVEPSVEYRLLLSFRLKERKQWAEQGFEIAWEEFDLAHLNQAKKPESKINLPVSISTIKNQYLVKGTNFEYRFDAMSGKLVSVKYAGKEMIKAGPDLNIWRSSVANEKDSWTRWLVPMNYTPGMGNGIDNAWRSLGLDNLSYKMDEVLISKTTDYNVILTVRAHSEGINYNTNFEESYTYHITGDGEMKVEHVVVPQGKMPDWLQCVGNRWVLNKELSNVAWYGKGPFENYPDRKTGAKTGIYKSTVKDMEEAYLLPQDYGLRTENRWVRMESQDGYGLDFDGDDWFDFSAQSVSTDNLTRARYPFQLQQLDGISFNFNYATSGVGCTAISVLNQYRVLPQKYSFKYIIRPYKIISASDENK